MKYDKIVVEIFDNKDEKIENDFIIKEIKDVVIDLINNYDVNFINYFEDEIDEIDEINDENYEKINDIENKIIKLYHKLKFNDLKSLKFYPIYQYFKHIYINIFDLKYFLKYKINNLKHKKYLKFYQYKRCIKTLNSYLNIENIDDVDVVDQLINHHILSIEDDYIVVNNKKYSYVLRYKDEIVDEINKKYYQLVNKSFNYKLINFDEINISSLDYFNNLYTNFNYNTIDNKLEDIDDYIYEDFNIDILNKYQLHLYNIFKDDYIDDFYNEIYENLFDDIIYDYNEDLKNKDIIYVNKSLLINKDYLNKLNDENNNEIFYYSFYSNEIRYDYNKLFEILLKDVNEDIDNYYDLIDIVDDYIYNYSILMLDDYNKRKYEINVDNITDLYFYVKYHYDLNLKKDNLIYI